ncbi:MAG: hydrogenase 4 subunit B, partial [Rhodoplanes sp.]
MLGAAVGRFSFATSLIYGLALAVSLVVLSLALTVLLSSAEASTVVLPLGLPGTGAHFRLDALSAFFLLVVGLGAASASLYALGYGRSEQTPLRVLPYYGAFLAGMTLVVLAADAYSFLFAWEFMSLASWALVVAHHRNP